MKISRGLRNNNPLNIRRNGTRWKGLAKEQSDKSFFCFDSPAWGYRAAIITLRNYKKIHGLHSLREWILRWAPPCENNTEVYIDFVCNRTGYKDDFAPDVYCKEQMCAVVSAMSEMENGVSAISKDVEDGWLLSLKPS